MFFTYCSMFAIFLTVSKAENRSDISDYSPSQEIDPVSTSTEIHCDTDVRLHKITYKWNINHFDLHRPVEGTQNNSIISPTFSSSSNDRIKWYLEILPGNETSEEISLHIRFSNQSKETKARARFTVEFLDSEGDLIIRFGDDSFYAFNNHDELWGWDNIQVDEVLLPYDRLKIVCNITFCENTNTVYYNNRTEAILRVHPECNLCQNFSDLLNNPEFSDLVLTLPKSGKEYPVHKAILAARSPAFASMFKHKRGKGKKIKRVNITGVDEHVFQEILRYIYADKCENIDKLAHGLLIAAHKFKLEGLKRICTEHISRNLTPGNALDILLLADECGFDELRSKAIQFIDDYHARVSNTSGWYYLVERNGKIVYQFDKGVTNDGT